MQLIWVYIIISVLVAFYALWLESKKDGFDEEKFFDLIIFSTAATFLSQIFLVKYTILIALIYVFTKKWKWSIFRVLDIFALGFSLFAGLYSLSAQVALGLLGLGFYFYFSRYRNSRYKSGYVFVVFNILLMIFSRQKELIFYMFLSTITLLIIFVRKKKDMANVSFPKDFLNLIKTGLKLKETRLKAEQKLLIKEDSYMQRGRATDNSDSLDEAALEDTPKEISDLRKKSTQRLLIDVKRALAAIKIGKYGLCEVCGQPIDRARLMVFPEATRCIKHAGN